MSSAPQNAAAAGGGGGGGQGGGGNAPPALPRKGAYSKHVQALHKDQLGRLQAKNAQEIDLLEQIKGFMKQKAALDKHHADGMLKLTTSHLNHKLAGIPDLQKGQDEQNQEVNVYNLWRKALEEEEKIAKARLAAVLVFQDEIEKDAKAFSKAKQAKTKGAFERLVFSQRELQVSVAELDRTKRVYFCEETGFEDVRDKSKNAEDRSKGRKKDLKSLFVSKSALKKQAGLLSAKQEEADIKSTGARNDYILSLASTNAHQDRYYKHDLQDTMKHLEGDFYERIAEYFGTMTRTQILALTAAAQSFNRLKDLGGRISRIYNYECYTKVYPSLGQHINYEHEAPPKDEIRTITPSEHDGGYSLNYEARQNASKLNQSVKTIKAYRKRIKACNFHKSKGLKHEPNDAGGPDLDTKINELRVAIRKAETEKAIAEARLDCLRAGGIAVDEYIDAFVATYTEDDDDELQVVPQQQQQQQQQQQYQQQQAEEEWPTEPAAAATQQEGWGDDGNAGWGAEEQQQEQQQPEEQQQQQEQGDNWASWNNDGQAATTAAPAAEDWASGGGGGWASFDQQQQQQPEAAAAETEEQQPEDTSAPAVSSSRAVAGLVLFTFEAQNGDELSVAENENLTILPDECDEEGWLMAMNAGGQKGYVPQNYVQVEGQEAAAQPAEGEAVAAEGAEGEQQQQYDAYGQQQQQGYGGYDQQQQQGYDGYGGMQRQDSYGRNSLQQQASVSSSQGYNNNGMYRQDSVNSQQGYGGGGVQRQDSQGSNGSWGFPGYGQQQAETASAGMSTIPEAKDEPQVPAAPPPASSSSEEEEDSSSAEDETESSMPPGLPPAPAAPPPGPPPAAPPQVTVDKPRPSLSFSGSLDSKDLCRALYDYDATGKDEITFVEDDVIRILKRCPSGVDDGWWLGELHGKIGLFPSVVVEELEDSDEAPDASSMTSPPSMAPPSFSPPPGLPQPPQPPGSAAPAAAPPVPPPVPAAPAPKAPPVPPPPAPAVQKKEPEPEVEPEAEVVSAVAVSVTSASASAANGEESSEEEESSLPPPPPPELKQKSDQQEKSDDQQHPPPPPPPASSSVPAVAVTKPTVPCVQVSVDEVPDIPRDDEGEEEDMDGGGVITAKAPQIAGAGQDNLDTMEIVVTAPTPTVQSPVEDRSSDSSGGKKKAAAAKKEEEEEEKTTTTESDGGNKVVERHSSADSSVSSSETSTSSQIRKGGGNDDEDDDTSAAVATPAAKEEDDSRAKDTTEDDEEEDSSSKEQGATQKKKPRPVSSSSSGSSAGGPDANPDSSEEDESEVALPPEQLELKQLKKLEQMKESTA